MNPTDYPFFISPLTEKDGGGFFIAFPDLPGSISDGETPREAIQNGYEYTLHELWERLSG